MGLMIQKNWFLKIVLFDHVSIPPTLFLIVFLSGNLVKLVSFYFWVFDNSYFKSKKFRGTFDAHNS